uniref:Uncharacterized protein n=1 Tax=Zooxanthella nutricula TaxID=1333877 RepID=A0A7S2LAI1_9DINO
MAVSNRAGEVAFQAARPGATLYGIDMQMGSGTMPCRTAKDVNADELGSQGYTLIANAHDWGALEADPRIREGGFSLVTYDYATEQYDRQLVQPEPLCYFLNKLRVGGEFVMSARVDYMDFQGAINFAVADNRAILASYWEKTGTKLVALRPSGAEEGGDVFEEIADAERAGCFEITYLAEHAGELNPRIAEPVLVIKKKRDVLFLDVAEAAEERRKAKAGE